MINDLTNIDWESFHFLRPLVLWLLLPTGLALVFGLLSISEEIKWKKFIAPHLRAYVIKKGSESKKRWLLFIMFLFVCIAVVGASGPVWEEIEIPGKILETPVVIALDLSQSMMADDIQPTRLERAKFKITDFLNANPGARVALVGYAGSAHTVVHLTHDYKIIKSHLDGLSPDIMPIPGTDCQAALVLADSIFAVTDAPGTLILITDDFDETIFNNISSHYSGTNKLVEILPMNTPGGASVPAFRGMSAMKDEDGNTIYSKLNQEIINKLSSLENININALTLDKSDMERLASSISENLEFTDADEKKENDWQDKGILLAIPLALLILVWFRKGVVLYSLLIIFGLSGCQSDRVKSLWLTLDYQGQQLYNSGMFIEAAERYQDPLHKGVAYFKAGEYDQAIAAFEQDTTAMGAYNLGLAQYKIGNYNAAGLAFALAVEIDPDFGDAKTNLAMMEQVKAGEDQANLEEAEESPGSEPAENIENKDMEDLGGGGQEATEEQMADERKEETVSTDIRKGKELDEVPEDFEAGEQDNSQKVLMRKVDDDPALFLKRKFLYQAKKEGLVSKNKKVKW